MKKEFDHILKDKLGEMKSAPPAGLWTKIEAGLGAEGAFDTAVKGKVEAMTEAPPAGMWAKISGALGGGKIPFYKTALFRWTAAASLLLLSYLGWRTLKDSDLHEQEQIGINESQKPVNQKNTAVFKGSATGNQTTSDKTRQEKTAMPSVKISHPEARKENTSAKLMKKSVPAQQSQATVVSSSDEGANVNIAHNAGIKERETAGSSEDEDILAVREVKTVFPLEEKIKTEETKKNDEKAVALLKEEKARDETATYEGAEKASEERENLSGKSSKKEVAEAKALTTNDREKTKEISNANEGVEPQNAVAAANTAAGHLQSNPRNINKYGISFGFSPALVNTGVNTISMKNFDLGLTYQNMNFVADLGLGVGFSSEKATYSMDYERYEFVKVQFVTDSLTFTYDTTNQTYTPVAVGHQEKVYDDVKYSYNSEAVTNYTYLNIPLRFGYQKDYKTFAIFGKAGINYSLIIAKTVKGMKKLDSQSKLTSLNYPVKTRTSSSISYLLSAGAMLKIRENISLSYEIFGTYYQNPFYADIDKRPYGYGMRFGLTYYLR